MPFVWINGNFIEESTASVSLRDTGLLYAAGAFTTMRSYDRKVYRLREHLARLRHSCEALFIPLQFKDDQLITAIHELQKKNELNDARLRLTVTRGMTEHDPLHGPRMTPTVFCTAAQVEPYPQEFYDRGITVTVVEPYRVNPYDQQAGHKTLNYFSRLAALRSANGLGAAEALWFSTDRYLQSGSISNVFVVKDGVVTTPPTPKDLHDKSLAATIPYPRSAVLPGVTRGAVIELARAHGVELRIGAVDINQLLEADEVFVTNSMMLVMPVCRIERRAIGDDKPGPITRKLSDLLRDDIARATAE